MHLRCVRAYVCEFCSTSRGIRYLYLYELFDRPWLGKLGRLARYQDSQRTNINNIHGCQFRAHLCQKSLRVTCLTQSNGKSFIFSSIHWTSVPQTHPMNKELNLQVPNLLDPELHAQSSATPAVMSATRVEELTKGSGGKHGQNNKNNSFVSPSCGYLMIWYDKIKIRWWDFPLSRSP